MGVDVLTRIEIACPRERVAAYASDPANVTAWYKNIKSVEWPSDEPVTVGSRIAFVAQFLGRELVYTYEVRELVPGERLVMSTSDGPFAMQTTYTWEDAGADHTRMTLRNTGQPTGFSKITAPIMATAMRRANRNDLALLKAILESAGDT